MTDRTISLCPPRNPGGSGRDHRWTLVVAGQGMAEHITLYGTTASNPQGAQEAANAELHQTYTWEPKGTGFRAVTTLEAVKP